MNRILFEPFEIAPDGRVVFGGARAEHVRTVLKGTVGQPLKTGVIGGFIGQSVIESVSPCYVAVRCSHEIPPLSPWCDLVLAPPRPRVMKRLLPQLATIGVRRIFLVGAEKVEKAFWGAQLLKSEIYYPLLVEGLMQGAVSTITPEIHQVRNFRRWLDSDGFERDFHGLDKRIVAHPYSSLEGDLDGNIRSPMDVAQTRAAEWADELACVPLKVVSSFSGRCLPKKDIPVFAIGPEGGWTDAEVVALESHGFQRHGLGPRILKTETAVIALLSRFM